MRANRRLLAYTIRFAIPGLALLLATSLVAQQSAPAGAPSPSSQIGNSSSSSPSPMPSSSPQPAAQASPGASAPAAPPGAFGEITGMVKSGAVPLPGVTITAANTLTGKKYVTSTDVDGSYRILVGSKGRYVVRAELSAFAAVTQEVLINADNPKSKADLSMLLLSRVQQQEEQQQQQQQQRTQQLPGAGTRAGLQQLSLAGSDVIENPSASVDTTTLANSGLPNAGLANESNESVAVSGSTGRNDMPTFDPGEMQDRMAQARTNAGAGGGIMGLPGGSNFSTGPIGFMMGGGPGGFGGGGPGGGGFGGGGRGMRNFNVNKVHGSLLYSFNGSPFDASPFALNSAAPEEKASYGTNTFGATVGGPLNIPHIYHGGNKTFAFLNYKGTRGNSPYDVYSTVPTQAERSGNFSGASVQLRDPTTGLPLTNNQLPSINPISAALLQFIPLPNLPGTANNFHFVSAAPSNSDSLLLRLNHNFGADQGMLGGMRRFRQQQRQQQQNGDKNQEKEKTKWSQSINGGLSFNRVTTDELNPFPGLGGQLSNYNYNVNAGHVAVKGLFLNTFTFNYNRSNTKTANHFTDLSNIESQLGITGGSQAPNNFGLPNLNFAPEFSSLQDVTPSSNLTQNFRFVDSMTLSKGKHGWTWGGDYRHQLVDLSSASNARGTFVFTGAATGLPFADFLMGFPQQTSLQSGASTYNFRANAFDLFAQDNWRVLKNFTLNLGLRYEYVSPLTELNDQLVNLDIAPGFTAVAPVQPGQVGPLTGIQYPASLVKPDRDLFAPRVGLAWKPFSKTVVRAGYSINYNLGQYLSVATQLALQPPFAVTETNNAATPTALTLANGFPGSNAPITNNYAIDPNYRLAYVQSWNLNIQQELKGDILINIGYTGAKGTHLDEVRAPGLDSSANGMPLNDAQPFLFESSNGSSIYHGGSLRVRKRMRNGLQLGGTYTYSKSIDDASSIGGGAVVVAQNDLDLAAERGLSSFDQRQKFTADYYYQLPFGKEKKWLHGDTWEDKFFGGFAFQGNITLASGFPFSPRIFGSETDLLRGTDGSLRPDLVPGQSIQLNNPTFGEWFNTAAFVAPAKGQFGDAGRNIIEGPGSIDFDMAFSKTIQVKEMQSLELRISATNVFNHPNFSGIDTTLGSPTFGQVISVASMRKAVLLARYRF